MPRRLIRMLQASLALLVVAACTMAGMAVALLAAGSQRQQTTIATLETSVRPDMGGHVDVYVPLVDWRVRLLEHDAPASIEIELRGIDRGRAGAGISSARAANRTLADVRGDTRAVVREAVEHGAIVAALGGVAGALVGGALVGAVARRRRWLLLALPYGAVVIASVLVPSVREMDDLADRRVSVSLAGQSAEELPRVLRFAEQLLYVGDEYEEHYRTALRSITSITSFAARSEAGAADGRGVVVFSDLHDNVFVLDALDAFAGDDPVVGVGDFVQIGARVEQRTAERVADLGGGLVAVSGNHDTAEYMQSLRRQGATVLDGGAQTYTRVAGLLVAGYPDPLERPAGSDGAHPLRVYGDEYRRQWQQFLEWWDALEQRPDVVLVHQHGFAHRLLDHLEERGDTGSLVILTGHDHEPHVHAEGRHAIVDTGTLGAGGLAAVGQQRASFARLDVAGGRVRAVDIVSIEPLTGEATTRRTRLGAVR